MFFASFRDGDGCKSYLVGCEESCTAAIIDPALDLVDRYAGEIVRHGLRLRYIIDTHTHAISPDKQRYPLAPVGGHQSEWSAKRPVSFEQLLAAAERGSDTRFSLGSKGFAVVRRGRLAFEGT